MYLNGLTNCTNRISLFWLLNTLALCNSNNLGAEMVNKLILGTVVTFAFCNEMCACSCSVNVCFL